LLFIVFDEGSLNPLDTRGNGGRIAVLVIGPHVLHGSPGAPGLATFETWVSEAEA
jgi:hypothetical protein